MWAKHFRAAGATLAELLFEFSTFIVRQIYTEKQKKPKSGENKYNFLFSVEITPISTYIYSYIRHTRFPHSP